MKSKKFLSLLISVIMCVMLFAVPVSADETTTTLALSNCNITTKAVRLVFNETLTNFTANLYDLQYNKITTTSSTSSTYATIKLSNNASMKLNNSYYVRYTATSASGTLDGLKKITFSKIWEDDFEGYANISGLETNYTTYNTGANGFEGFSLETSNGNTQLKLTKDQVYLDPKAAIGETATYEIDVLAESSTEAEPVIPWFIIHTNAWAPGDAPRLITVGDWFNYQKMFDRSRNAVHGETFAFIRKITNNSTTFYGATFRNGEFWGEKSITTTIADYTRFAIAKWSSGSNVLIDNMKIYTTTDEDIDVSTMLILDNISATRSEVTLDYSGEIPDDATFKLMKDGAYIESSFTKSEDKKTVVVKPAEAFLLDTVYVLQSEGFSDAGYKAFKLEKMFEDDFDSYSTASDMDGVWNVSYKDFAQSYTVSGYNTTFEKQVFYPENGWLVLNDNINNGVINVNTNDNSKWYKYTLEFDVKRDSGTKWSLDVFYHMATSNDKPHDYTNLFRLGLWTEGIAQGTFTKAAVTKDTNVYPSNIYPNDSYHFKLTTKTGNDVQIFKDGENVLSQTYTGALESNRIGFRVIHQNSGYKQYIDNVLVYKFIKLAEASAISKPTVTGEFEADKQVECSADGGSDFDVSYKWYRGDDYFSDDWELIENADSKNYTVTNADMDKYLYCEAEFTHKTVSDFKVALKTEALHAPVPPVARNYKLTYNKDENETETLTASYEYFDANGDEKKNETFVWEESATGEDNSWTTMSETSSKYTIIKDKDINKYIRCTLTVENTISEKSTPVTDAYTMPFAPAAKEGSVTISGSSSVGETITAKYEYFDTNGDKEAESGRNWYRVDSNGNRTLVASGSVAYGVKSEDRGYSIQFGYKPVSEVYPEEGTEVFSNKIAIPAAVITGGVNTGNSFGGSSSGSGSITVTKPASKEETVNKEPQQTETDIDMDKVFSDMKNHWSKEYVGFLYKKGIVNGRGDAYCPEDKVTRAEWVTMLLRAIEKDGQGAYGNCFSDVNANDWYAKDIQTAFSLGIINGSDNKFMPNESMTREQMVKIAIDAYELVKGEINSKGDLSAFADATDISDWAVSYMEKAVKLGIINGMDDNRLAPKNTVTRAEAAAVLKRAYDLIMAN